MLRASPTGDAPALEVAGSGRSRARQSTASWTEPREVVRAWLSAANI
jgi:hypothetical protein